MLVGDVRLDPRRKRVHVVFVVNGEECDTLAIGQMQLATWAETPDDLRNDRTVKLEHYDKRSMHWWRDVPLTVQRLARLYAFADTHVTVEPCSTPLTSTAL